MILSLFLIIRYRRDELIEGPVYSGKDRHNAEIAAFHLSLLLGLRRVPLTAGRTLNLQKEIMPVASKSLLRTFVKDGMKNNYVTCYVNDFIFLCIIQTTRIKETLT
jgi:hypothetical protein